MNIIGCEFTSNNVNSIKEVGMNGHDFFVGFPKTLGKFYYIWLLVDRLTNPSLFIPVSVDYNAERLDKIYFNEIVRLYVVPLYIILDRGTSPQIF